MVILENSATNVRLIKSTEHKKTTTQDQVLIWNRHNNVTGLNSSILNH